MSNGDIRAREILKRLNGATEILGAEIGVAGGETSIELLIDKRVTLIMVDNYKGCEDQPQAYKDTGDYHANKLTAKYQQDIKNMAHVVTDFAQARRREVWTDSVVAAAGFPDGIFDFVFIDADHSYEGCHADIEAWRSKIKAGGLLCGHDYDHPDLPKFGVKRAVDEAVAMYNWKLDLGENYTWFVRL